MFSIFYVTTPDLHTAERIAEALVQQGLIACANVLPQMTSYYRWQGKFEKSQECVLLLKSKSDLKQKLTDVVEEMHPYDCPCVLELPIESVNPVYRDWLLDQLTQSPE